MSPTRRRNCWEHCEDSRNIFHDPTTSGKIRKLVEKDHLFRKVLSFGISCGEPYVSRFQKKLRDKLDVEVKLAGLESTKGRVSAWRS